MLFLFPIKLLMISLNFVSWHRIFYLLFLTGNLIIVIFLILLLFVNISMGLDISSRDIPRIYRAWITFIRNIWWAFICFLSISIRIIGVRRFNSCLLFSPRLLSFWLLSPWLLSPRLLSPRLLSSVLFP